MPIHEKMMTNPELIDANKIVGQMLDELLDKQWGEATISFKAQGGQVVSATWAVEQKMVFKRKSDDEIK